VTSSAAHEAMPMILASGRGMFKRALLLYALAFIVVAVVAKAAIVAVGLPEWVFPGALIVMALGLPVILFTAYVHRTTRRVLGATPTYTPGGTPSLGQGTMQQLAIKASPHVSWRRAAIGGMVAVAGFVLLIGAYMVLRAMGIGPAGSLLAAGTLAQDSKLLVADLESPASDSTLGPVVTDAFRTALGQSRSVTVVQATAVSDALRRMERPADSRIDFALAREIATREGIKAVMDGSLLGVGGRYVIALRLVSAQTGDELATFRETADDQSEILPAVDRLAKEVRAKIGESLKHVQSAPPLEQVTTSSLDALKKYVQGVRVIGEGDFTRGAALLEEAVAMDTGFAMAYRKLGIEYGNRELREKAGDYYERAFRHIDRLTDAERYLLLGSYYQLGKHQDAAKSLAAYERLLEIQPNNTAGLNNLATAMLYTHQFARAESLLVRAIGAGPVATVHYRNMARAQVALGKRDSVVATIEGCRKAFPRNIECEAIKLFLHWQRAQYDSITPILAETDRRLTDPGTRAQVAFVRADLARARGKLSEANRSMDAARDELLRAGYGAPALDRAAAAAADLAWYRGDTAGARRQLDDALARTPLRSVVLTEAPYVAVVQAYALSGRPDRARAIMAEWTSRRSESPSIRDSMFASRMRGEIAVAEGKYAEAQAHLRFTERRGCPVCDLPMLGRSFDLAGAADSAIAVYGRYLNTPWFDRIESDGPYLPGVHKRLGELYEAKGMRDSALAHYRAFIDLWKGADAELQPKVTDARQRVAALTRGTDARR
jgi:tetratricopeptide (TPR) repeat protein